MKTNGYARLAPIAALVAAALALAGCGGSSGGKSADGRDRIRLGISTPSWNAGFATLAVSEARGFFAQENLDVDVQLFPSGTQAAQQVVSGQIDVGLVTPEPVAIGQARNTDLTYFAQYWTRWIYTLKIPQDSPITSVADLKDKRVGVTAVASSGGTFARTAMKMQGLDPESVKLVPIGAGAEQLNAIKSGKVDALALWDTQYQIVENAGVKLKPLPVPGTENLFGGGFAVKKENLKKKEDLLVRLGRAFAKGAVFAQASPEAAVGDLWKLHPETKGSSSVPEDQLLAGQVKVLKVRLDGMNIAEGEKGPWGRMDPAAVTGTVKFMTTAGLIDKEFPATDIYTDDLIAKINAFSYDEVRAAAKKAA
ncbi:MULTISPECIES: ABC transporter substrate-binding protein [Actinomadura]|uniref:ABC transporter substrate-binding protein n=1 Tax=Actinomadura TaxID=1988 RepID=UPI0003AD066A|nr:NrtA/SsuA/CpmA family ABC transporter substrate-binding protein [Actinomadura madurae]SPT58130.1 Putative aliphatic sulfonates-binding protein precursor [Actinomadura madurae]